MNTVGRIEEGEDHMLVLSEASPGEVGETLIRIIDLLSALDFTHSDDALQLCRLKLILCPSLQAIHSSLSITRERVKRMYRYYRDSRRLRRTRFCSFAACCEADEKWKYEIVIDELRHSR